MTRFLLMLVLLPSTAWSQDREVDWSLDLEAGYGHDSNITVDDVDLTTESGDRFLDLGLSGVFGYELDDGLKLTGDFLFSEKQYRNIDDFDGRLSMLSLGLEKKLGRMDLDSSIRYIDYRLDGKGFLDLTQASVSASSFLSRRIYLRSTYEYSDESFNLDTERDNTQDRVSLRGYYFINGLQRYLLTRVTWASDDARDDLFDSRTREVAASYRQKGLLGDLPVTVEIGYRYTEREYGERLNVLVAGFRQDRRRRVEFRIDWQVTNRLSAEFHVFRNDYRSNLASADYDQGVGQVSLKYALIK